MRSPRRKSSLGSVSSPGEPRIESPHLAQHCPAVSHVGHPECVGRHHRNDRTGAHRGKMWRGVERCAHKLRELLICLVEGCTDGLCRDLATLLDELVCKHPSRTALLMKAQQTAALRVEALSRLRAPWEVEALKH